MEGFVSKLKDQSEKIMEEESKDKIKPKFNQEKQQVKEKELKDAAQKQIKNKLDGILNR